MRNLSSLTRANLLVLGLLIAYALDQGLGLPDRTLPDAAGPLGAASFALIAASVWLAGMGSPAAPGFSVFVGVVIALAYTAMHLLADSPKWISDPYWDLDPGALTWIILIGLLLAAVRLVVVAVRYKRNRHRLRPIYRA